MRQPHKLKKLQLELKGLISDADNLQSELKALQDKRKQKLDAISDIRAQIHKLNEKDGLKVSDHAIVRYFERVKGFDMAEIQGEILSEEVLVMVEKLGGNGSFPNKDYSVVMKNNVVVTII